MYVGQLLPNALKLNKMYRERFQRVFDHNLVCEGCKMTPFFKQEHPFTSKHSWLKTFWNPPYEFQWRLCGRDLLTFIIWSMKVAKRYMCKKTRQKELWAKVLIWKVFSAYCGKKIPRNKPIYSVRRTGNEEYNNMFTLKSCSCVGFDVVIIQHVSEKNRGFLGSERDLRAGN